MNLLCMTLRLIESKKLDSKFGEVMAKASLNAAISCYRSWLGLAPGCSSFQQYGTTLFNRGLPNSFKTFTIEIDISIMTLN